MINKETEILIAKILINLFLIWFTKGFWLLVLTIWYLRTR